MIFSMIIGTLEKITPARTAKGTPSLRMRIAADHRYMRQGKMTMTTYRFSVVAWGNLAQMHESHEEGVILMVRGMFRPRAYDGDSGRKEWIWELVADEIERLRLEPDLPFAEQGAAAEEADRPPPDEPL